ncbi:MAG TPA: HAD-IIB family hydrolase [Kiloniellales bacterium]|nr:HAD-IIB family hydrolase [Kiloniellales bacterium]
MRFAQAEAAMTASEPAPDDERMLPLSRLPASVRAGLRGIFFDIDETLTTGGRLTAEAYGALEALHESGLIVVPITGRPAGWCDHIARMWPVDAVVGENGAFYFRYDRRARRLIRRFLQPEAERRENRRRLAALGERILAAVPGAALASDQGYRESDLAIDWCEDVAPLPRAAVERIVALFDEAGATAKISSIHVNGWFGIYDKLAMTRILMEEAFGLDLEAERSRFVFVGDSPNDSPMFRYFPHAVGVANVRDFIGRKMAAPRYVTERRAGAGFAEVAAALLSGR